MEKYIFIVKNEYRRNGNNFIVFRRFLLDVNYLEHRSDYFYKGNIHINLYTGICTVKDNDFNSSLLISYNQVKDLYDAGFLDVFQVDYESLIAPAILNDGTFSIRTRKFDCTSDYLVNSINNSLSSNINTKLISITPVYMISLIIIL